jgi:hypothetical protein
MEDWEFLIQREGDRGWRSIKTGNLQLREGNYRIVANSNLLNAAVQLRITHQSLGEKLPQRRSLTRERVSNAKGTLLVIPFTQLHSGMWQFVCSSTTTTQTAWHKVLKLRVLPRTEDPLPNSIDNRASSRADRSLPPLEHRTPTAAPVAVATIAKAEAIDEIPTPTQPLVAIATDEDSGESWAEGLERLLEQIERDSLTAQPPAVDKAIVPTEIDTENGIGLTAIDSAVLPFRATAIELERTVFAGMRPGNRLDINGACNLPLLSTNLIRAVKIDRLSICLRHPQTSETIVAIDRAVPALLDTFKFSGRVDLPNDLAITLLRGEVNLYDRHNIQLGSSGFTVTVDLQPISKSDASVLSLLNASIPLNSPPGTSPEDLRARLDRELQLEKFTPQGAGATIRDRRSTTSTHIPPLNPHQYPSVPLEYKREPTFKPQQPDRSASIRTENRDRVPPIPIPAKPENLARPIVTDITGDLEIDFGKSNVDRSSKSPEFDTWEIVIDE